MKVSGLCRAVFLVLFFLVFSSQTAIGSGGGITVVPDVSFLIQIANFVFLIWILNTILYKPIRKILHQRKEKIDGLEKNIAGLHENAIEQEKLWESGIKEARAKGLHEKDDMIHEAEEEEKKIIEKINQKMMEDQSVFQKKISSDIENVRSALQKEIEAFSDTIVEKILGRAL